IRVIKVPLSHLSESTVVQQLRYKWLPLVDCRLLIALHSLVTFNHLLFFWFWIWFRIGFRFWFFICPDINNFINGFNDFSVYFLSANFYSVFVCYFIRHFRISIFTFLHCLCFAFC